MGDLWPEEKITRADLVKYYRAMWPYMEKYLTDRPLVQNYYYGNIHAKHEFVMDAGNKAPDWVPKYTVSRKSNGETISYVLCQSFEVLEFLVSRLNIEINVWNSRYTKPDYPDYLVIDLDPSTGEQFEDVKKTAIAFKEFFDEVNLPVYLKTSGALGLHLFSPLGARLTYSKVKPFVRKLCEAVNKKLPAITTLESSKAKRKDRIYLDYSQNGRVNTMVACYSVRPRPGAPVSTPLAWNEIDSLKSPSEFTMFNILKRVEKIGDLFSGVLK